MSVLSRKEQELYDALSPQAEAEGVEIVTIEIVGSRKAPTIRVYIDTPEGVGFDELSSAQAWINRIMDEVDPFPGAYTLEVSSPGIDRPLRTPEHFQRFAGETAAIQLRDPIDGRARYTGRLEGFSDGAVLLSVNDETLSLPLQSIKRAHVKGVIDFNSSPGTA